MKHCYKFILPILFTLLIKSATAQDVNITQTELQGGDLVIHYELIDEDKDRRYTLHLYSSKDNYVQPLQNVEGDIGVDIRVGGNKKVIWHAREELGDDFNGNIGLELKGSIYTPFVSLDNFEDYGVLKRGKPYQITWSGGRGDNILQFELYQGDKKVHVFEERPNTGKTSISLPTDVKPGKNYYFKISDTRNRDEVVYTGNFKVRRKIPLVLKLGTGLILAGGVAILLDQMGGGTGENTGEEDIIPFPEDQYTPQQ